MAITIQNSIPDVVLAKMPVVAQLRSDNYLSAAGSAAELELIFSGGAAVGETFSLEWTEGGYQITFSFVASPGTTGKQLPAYVAGAVADWLPDVADYLEKNYLLSRDFDIVASADRITLTAKESGTDYSLTVVNNVTNMTLDNTAGVDKAFQDFYETIADVYVQETYATTETGYKRQASIGMIPDDNGDCFMYFEKILQSHLTGFFPDYNESTQQKALGSFIKWYFLYCEYYGDTPEYQLTSRSDTFFAIRGGLKTMDWPDNAYWDTWLPYHKRFLTWKSGERRVTEDQQEYLSFLNYSATATTLTVICTMNYSDNSSSNADVHTVSSPIQKEIYCFPVGYTQLDIDTIKTAGKTVLSYEIHIEDEAGNTVSETVTYRIETITYNNRRVFYYENSLSGIDTLVCTGRREDSVGLVRMNTERIMDTLWDESEVISNGNTENYRNLYRWNYQISSGFKNRKAAVTEMIEFMISRVIREDRDSKWCPVIVEQDQFRLYKDDDDVYFISFGYSDALDNESYSELVAVPGSGS